MGGYWRDPPDTKPPQSAVLTCRVDIRGTKILQRLNLIIHTNLTESEVLGRDWGECVCVCVLGVRRGLPKDLIVYRGLYFRSSHIGL